MAQKTIIAGSVIPDKTNTPLDARARISVNSTDLNDIRTAIVALGNPFEGQIVYNDKTKLYYSVTSVYINEQGVTTIVVEDLGNEIPIDIELTEHNTLKEEPDSYIKNVHYDISNTNISLIGRYVNDSIRARRPDQPIPVTLKVAGNSLSLFNSPIAHVSTHVKTFDITGKTELEIYNLIPGVRYFYKIDNNPIADSFVVEGKRRFIWADNVRNIRDLGGIQTEDGGYIAYDKIFRGGELNGKSGVTATQKAIDALNDLNIGLDFDLRNSNDVDGGTYENTPLNADYTRLSFIRYEQIDPLSDSDKTKIKNAFETVANAVLNGKKVYTHCAWGYHRCGFLCTLIEGVLGVKQCEIDKDFELSSFALYGDVKRTDDNYAIGTDFINNNYEGSWTNFLIDCGVSQQLIKNFRYAMLVDANKQAELKPQYYNVTYAQLYKLKQEGFLVTGAKYRMIDYDTEVNQPGNYIGCSGIVDQTPAKSAYHPFDLVLTALSNSELDSNVKALHSARDTEGYFANSDLNKWELKYDIENNKDKYDWALNGDFPVSEHKHYTDLFANIEGYEGEYYFRVKWHELRILFKGLNEEEVVVEEISNGSAPTYFEVGDRCYLQLSPKIEDFVHIGLIGETSGISVPIDNITKYMIERNYEHFEGKGVIYYMKDEHNNECGYDFKNVLYKQDDDSWLYTFNTNSSNLITNNKIQPYSYGTQYLNNIVIKSNWHIMNNKFGHSSHDIFVNNSNFIDISNLCSDIVIDGCGLVIIETASNNINLYKLSNVFIEAGCYNLDLRKDEDFLEVNSVKVQKLLHDYSSLHLGNLTEPTAYYIKSFTETIIDV